MDNGACGYRRFLEGDASGLEELITLYKDGLILYINTFVGDLSLAEELSRGKQYNRCVLRK